jgi:hypothetical protein
MTISERTKIILSAIVVTAIVAVLMLGRSDRHLPLRYQIFEFGVLAALTIFTIGIAVKSWPDSKRSDNDLPTNKLERNSSGQGKDSVVPPEVRGFNWGALVFGSIWNLSNLPMSRLRQIIQDEGLGYSGYLFFSFFLPSNGNELSWKYKRWASVEAFKRTQRRWKIAALGLVGFFVVGFAIAITWAILDSVNR